MREGGGHGTIWGGSWDSLGGPSALISPFPSGSAHTGDVPQCPQNVSPPSAPDPPKFHYDPLGVPPHLKTPPKLKWGPPRTLKSSSSVTLKVLSSFPTSELISFCSPRVSTKIWGGGIQGGGAPQNPPSFWWCTPQKNLPPPKTSNGT